jgi:hypothetical protein
MDYAHHRLLAEVEANMVNWKCRLHIHKWKYSGEPFADKRKGDKRQCIRCGRKQRVNARLETDIDLITPIDITWWEDV